MNQRVLLKIQGTFIVLGGLFIVWIGAVLLLFEYGNNMYNDHQAYIRDMFVFWGTNTFLLIFLIICVLSAYFGIKRKHLSQHIIVVVSLFQLFGMIFIILYTTSSYDNLQDAINILLQIHPKGRIAFILALSHIIMNIGILIFTIKTIMSNNKLLQATDA